MVKRQFSFLLSTDHTNLRPGATFTQNTKEEGRKIYTEENRERERRPRGERRHQLFHKTKEIASHLEQIGIFPHSQHIISYSFVVGELGISY